MPMYEYRCRSCGDRFEELVPSSSIDDSEVACPACGQHAVEKLMSAFASGGTGSSEAVSAGSSCGTGGFT